MAIKHTIVSLPDTPSAAEHGKPGKGKAGALRREQVVSTPPAPNTIKFVDRISEEGRAQPRFRRVEAIFKGGGAAVLQTLLDMHGDEPIELVFGGKLVTISARDLDEHELPQGGKPEKRVTPERNPNG